MVICILLAGVLYLIGLGAFAAFRGIGQMAHGASRTQSSVSETVSSAPPASSSPSKAESASASHPPEVISSPAVPLSSTPRDAVAPTGYFDDALLIGDSRTEALRNYDGLDNATYYAVKGLMVSTIFTKPSIEIHGKKLPVMQALKEEKYGKIYIMLGVNELGWSSFNTFIQDYQKVIDGIKTSQPGAVIYVQSILPVTAKKSETDKVYNNQKIEAYNQAIEEMAAKSRVRYLAVNTAVSDSEGNLPEDASVDGVHLNGEYCKKWCEYLRTHTNGERD
ncbi:GDSL-type esterase/lipase family protein [Caproiciproducens sp.]